LPTRITVTADLAWTLEPVSNDFGKKCLVQWGLDVEQPFIGVNLNNERFVLQQEPRLCEKMGIFLDQVIEKSGAYVLFFCNEIREGETFDREANLKVLNHMAHGNKAFLVPNRYWTPQQMLSLIGCCQITVGIRYHFCLFSILQGVPFIALQRSDKVADLCWDMNWPYGATLRNLNVSALLDMISDIEQERPSLLKTLPPRTKLMREKAYKNRVALDTLVREVGK
jgi:polysaccharide pyruvyl transferase WcaK-like protein